MTQQNSSPCTTEQNPQKMATRQWLIRFGIQLFGWFGVGLLLLFLIGVAQRLHWISGDGTTGAPGAESGDAHDHGETKRYVCPMNCTPAMSEPGRCPVCGMKLVEATESSGGDGTSVTIEPAARRLANIQTATSVMHQVNRAIRTIGSIAFDESRLSTISAYTAGRLETMYADYVGVRVREGDNLALVYSPQLFSAQAEYITSLEGISTGGLRVGDSSLHELARENLSELGMTDQQIESLTKSGKPQSRIRIKSPQSGTVIEKMAVEGDYVNAGEELYRIADLTTVWLMLDLFPDDAAVVRFGQQVEAEIQSIPGEVFVGRVAFIEPTVSQRTRTVRVRIEIVNLDGKLRPGDYATARITVPAIPTETIYDPALANKFISPMHPQVIRDEPGGCPLCGMDLIPTSELGYAAEPLPEQLAITVPRDAILRTGNRSVLYVETEPGRFEIRRVTVGPMNDDEAVIIEGLSEGETVATSGNFLIDSQMQLAGNPSLIDPTRAPQFAAGPVALASVDPLLLVGDAADDVDLAYSAYFDMQNAMAADLRPPPSALRTLSETLTRLESSPDIPGVAQIQFGKAKRSTQRMGNSLETARRAYRGVSHALLRAATAVRGPQTAQHLLHYYCPMVPGGGGDWMQADGKLANPYWGSEMLRCGELVRDMALTDSDTSSPANQ